MSKKKKNFHRSNAISRRSLLRGLGAGALVLAMPPIRTAKAQSARSAKRFINFFVGNGMVPHHFYPQGPNVGAQPMNESWLEKAPGAGGYVLSPLLERRLANGNPVYTKATVIEGVRFGCAAGYGSPDHGKGGISMLSGGQYAGGKWTHPSIDQVIAAHHVHSVGAPHKAIFLNADVTRKNSGERLSYSWREGGSAVSEVNDPERALRAFFDPDGFGAGTPVPPKVDARKLKVLSANRAQLEKLSSRLGETEQSYLDAHINSLDEIERRLTAGSLPPIGECTEPSFGGAENFQGRVDDLMSVIIAALTCGRTNIVTMCLQGSGSDVSYDFVPEMNSTREHHDISHDGDEPGMRLHSVINRWAVDRVAQFAATLDSIPEGTGTMLDNSIVSLSYELGKGRGHEHNNVPHIIFGGAGGYYRTGQYVKLANREVNDLLLTHVRACGVSDAEVSTVGLPEFNSGIISELIA
jgi:hypothetical protein